MSDNSSEGNDGTSSDDESLLSQDVQDYLDLLLNPATEKNDAQVNTAPPVSISHIADKRTNLEEEKNTHSKGASRSLTMVAGTAVSRGAIKPKRREDAPADRQPQKSAGDTERPFAEPVKPLTFKVPLPKVQVEPEVEAEPEIEKKPAEPEIKVKEPEVKETEAKSPEPPPVKQEPSTEETVEVIDELDAAMAFKTSEWLENGRPSWAQDAFECLLFKVGGLSLAVPLVELGIIHPIAEEITPIFGQIDWFMGLLSVKGGNLKTVDSAKIVMPERYSVAMRENYEYVISINGVDWGLAVDSVSSAITLQPEDVKWRTERGLRPWLAGTVVEHMCALVDISQLAKMFVDQDRQRG